MDSQIRLILKKGVLYMAAKKRKYSKEFKLEAVALAKNSDKSMRETASNLGIDESLLRQWRAKYQDMGETAFPGHGKQNLTSEEAEIKRLKRDLEIAKEERDILKKAVAIFSKKP
jgi:transposase